MKKQIVFMMFLLCAGPAFAVDRLELNDGTVIFGYHHSDMPHSLQREQCDAYGFKDKRFTPLSPGKYTVKDGHEIMMDDICLYPKTGQALLTDGATAEFFQENSFNMNGEIVYRDGVRVKDDTLTLKTGQSFTVKNGYIENWGLFENGKIQYEDRE